MEIKFASGKIILNKDVNEYDSFVMDFLERLSIDYVIISGYVSLIFGRTRMTEDIDMLIGDVALEDVRGLWTALADEFYCINAESPEEGHSYLMDRIPLRFAKHGTIATNMEVKIAKSEIDKYVLHNPLIVVLNGTDVNISPLEMQLAYKLYLGSDKDIEDARYLYSLFSGKIKEDELVLSVRKLGMDLNVLEVLQDE